MDKKMDVQAEKVVETSNWRSMERVCIGIWFV